MFSIGATVNSVQRQIFIQINDDALVEPDETFRVTFELVNTSQGDSTNFGIGSMSETIVTILDQDGKLILIIPRANTGMQYKIMYVDNSNAWHYGIHVQEHLS